MVLDSLGTDWKLLLIRQSHNRSPIGRLIWTLRQRRQLVRWYAAGRQAELPELAKHQLIRDYARRFGLHTLVETGTFVGDTVYAMRRDFSRIVSIELDRRLAENARRRFARERHIAILHGDSKALLPQVLKTLDHPALFWLDAHWSGGVTARGEVETPLLDEVATIASHPVEDHVILIDDARFLGRRRDYPSLEQLQQRTADRRPNWLCEEAYGVVRFTPRQ
jgi:hypothetical protein